MSPSPTTVRSQAVDRTRSVSRRRAIPFATLIIAAIFGSTTIRAQPPSLAPLAERKNAIAADLARQAALCSARRDTDHFAFKGCIDWHSAVHGVWALLAYEKATG